MVEAVRPKFSSRFRRMCQVAAVAGVGREAKVVDRLLLIAMLYDSGPWRQRSDWSHAIEELFSFTPSESDLDAALQRAIETRAIHFNTFEKVYRLDQSRRDDILTEISIAEALENRVKETWLASVSDLIDDELTTTSIWDCLIEFLRRLFLSSGADALALLSEEPPELEAPDSSGDPFEDANSMFKVAADSVGIDQAHRQSVQQAVQQFLRDPDDDRLEYCEQLLGSTFDVLALGLDSETRDSLKGAVPALQLFLDSNVIYSIIGAHSQPFNSAIKEIVRVVRDENLPFDLYYHQATLAELERTLTGARHSLCGKRWTPAVSRAILNQPSLVSSIEVMYHTANSETPTPPEIFMGRFEHLPTLLAEFGLRIFRPALAYESPDSIAARAQIVMEFDGFVKERRRRTRPYEALSHDITLWLEVVSRQAPTRRGPIFSGALFLSADHLLARFDREVLSVTFGSGRRVVARPDALLQSLRPFLASTENFESMYGRLFGSVEFRSPQPANAATVRRVAAYLSTYDDLSEETATKLLVNSVLMDRLKDYADSSDEFSHLIDSHLVDEIDRLQEERDQVVSQARQISEEIRRLKSQSGVDAAVLDGIAALADKIGKSRSHTIIYNMGATTMNSSQNDGDVYNNEGNQVAAQGRFAHAEKVTMQQDQRSLTVDLDELVDELNRLRQALIGEAKTPEEFRAIAEVQAAADASSERAASQVALHLKNAGQWALGVAKKIGASLAEEAIRQSLGMG